MTGASRDVPSVGLPGGSVEGVAVLGPDVVGSLAPISIRFVQGTYPLTAASRITLGAVAAATDRLTGRGIDWGCGTGCLAITAAKLPQVEQVVGLDVLEANVRVASRNVAANRVDSTVSIVRADSYRPLDNEDAAQLNDLRGHVGFVIANPPASPDDDGFNFRRRVVREARGWLRHDATFLIQVSVQYGEHRVRSLERELPGLEYEGCVASTPWVPFEQSRPDLGYQLVAYADHEAGGGAPYEFGDPRDDATSTIDARTALDVFRRTGTSPLTRWQVHRFCWREQEKGQRA